MKTENMSMVPILFKLTLRHCNGVHGPYVRMRIVPNMKSDWGMDLVVALVLSFPHPYSSPLHCIIPVVLLGQNPPHTLYRKTHHKESSQAISLCLLPSPLLYLVLNSELNWYFVQPILCYINCQLQGAAKYYTSCWSPVLWPWEIIFHASETSLSCPTLF